MTPAENIIRALQGVWAVAALFAIGLLLRAVAALIFGDVSQGVQIWEYGEQAMCAIQTGGDLCLRDPYGYPYISALMPPLTSYLWVGLFEIFGIGETARAAYIFLNVVMGTLCAPLLYALARQMKIDPAPAFIAALSATVYPTFVFVSAGYHATNYTLVLMLGFALAFLHVAKSFSWRLAFAAGVLAGLSVLTRNELVLVAGASGLLLLWFGRRQFPRAFGAAAAMGIGLALVMSPWLVRNYIAFDRVIPIGTQGGYNMWIGFGPYARGSGNQYDNDPVARAAGQAIREAIPVGDPPNARYELRQQEAFLADALVTIEEGGVGRILRLTVDKFVVLWTFDWTDPITHSPGYWGPWVIAHVLALYGLFVMWRGPGDRGRPARTYSQKQDAGQRPAVPGPPQLDPRGVALVVLFLCVFTFAYSISSVFARYRMHMEPFIFLFSGIGAWALIERWRAGGVNPAAARVRT